MPYGHWTCQCVPCLDPAMYSTLLVLCFVQTLCLCLDTMPTDDQDKVKIIEDYVVLANFDENSEVPQLKGRPPSTFESRIINTNPRKQDEGHLQEAVVDVDLTIVDKDKYLYERDIAHGPPVGLSTASSLMAIGLITFLMLLSSLQNSLTMMLAKPTSLLDILGLPPLATPTPTQGRHLATPVRGDCHPM